jgi:Protein of unknown function (DUF3085)
MLRFKGSELRPVLAEAKTNNCPILLVKDQGVYFMSDRGERRADGRQKLLAYAIGCNPDVDDFEQWWNLARIELGGDDFGESFDINDPLFSRLLGGNEDLVVRATKTRLYLETATPVAEHSEDVDRHIKTVDPKIDHPQFFCLDCDSDTFLSQEYYMLKDRLWKQIHPKIEGMLCLKCAERRLGRALTGQDFKRVPLNTIQARLCPELAERMNRHP